MSKITEKIKPQPTEPTFWQATESLDATTKKITIKKDTQTAVAFENNVTYEDTIVGDKGKLYKIDFAEKNEIEFDRETLPKPIGWDIADGDYVKDYTFGELPKMQALRELKNFKLIFLIASLAVTALVVLLFAVIASKA
ncbi:MAG: hypothetical protein WCZ90_06220 [Melioribacteraceae bacterium]